MDGLLAPVLAALLAIVGYVSGSVKIVNQGDVALVERLGRYRRTLQPGLNFTIPLVDSIVVDTTREQVLDVPAQEAITADNVPLKADGLVYWKIVDLYLVHYGVDDIKAAVEGTVLTTLRNEIGKRVLQDILTARDQMSVSLLKELDESTSNWGVKVTRVEIKDIFLGNEVTSSMAKAKAAENEREAAMEVARGRRDAAILEAESRRDAAIAEAQGIVNAMRLITAEIQAQGAELSGASKAQVLQEIVKFLVAQRFVDASQKIGESNNSKVLFMDPKSMNQALDELLHGSGEVLPGAGKPRSS
jgi:regulator of protease activity HflC (stomatin/prohibitin superfamily)